MRVPLIVGNWKMHKTVGQALELVDRLLPLVSARGVEVVLAPPFTALQAVGRAVDGTGIGLASQNMHWDSEGAYTGEVSAPMLREIGCRYVILGHSERRQLFGETDESISRKTVRAVETGLVPILCVGESLAERDAGQAFSVVDRQLSRALEPLVKEAVEDLVVAYEPVWAIGTGRTATAAQAQEVHAFLRKRLASLAGDRRAERTRVLYGGSVKPSNIAELMGEPDVDGALVGGASLEAETFASIIGFHV